MDCCTEGTYGNCNTNAESMRMSYDLLNTITNGFSEEIGSGSYGVVYKGKLDNGKEIAVKKLRDLAALDEKNFNNEFQNLARLKHRNIVQLVGYCNESEDQIAVVDGKSVPAIKMHVALCFEYIDNGSLHRFISDENELLEWDNCYKIIKGICEGLRHLRKGLDKPVWHLDLKPDNILLDKNMTPKIADFGLSRLIGEEKTRRTMNSVGTRGYLPPEYIRFQLISGAFDLFSLGVIMTKIMVGTKVYNDCADMKPRKLVKHVQDIWKIKLQETVRPGSLEVYCQQVKACIELASKCLREDRTQRPCIDEIINTLNETETMMTPTLLLQTEQFHNGGETNFPSNRSIKLMSFSGMDNTAIDRDTLEEKLHDPAAFPICLPFEFLQDITNNFSKKKILGTGVYGVVYKGVLRSGKKIAVKMLFQSHVNRFQKEIANLVGLKHQNIVKLVGYCEESRLEAIRQSSGKYVMVRIPRSLLCFEYVVNKNLDWHLDRYDWCTCYEIIKGICNGLSYLHEGLPSPVVHLNLKPTNILLDQNMVPKIGDIGLSEPIRTTDTFLATIRYLPPEFIAAQVTSTKSDIYSLGIIMTEILGGRCFPIPGGTKSQLLGRWRTRLLATFKGRSVEGYCQQVKKCIEIALACVEKDRHKRPSIGEITRMLNETEILIHDEDSNKLFDVHPKELRFSVKPNRHASCLLQLHNRQDYRVVFRLVPKKPRYLTNLPIYGVVPPRCTYTLSLTTTKQPPRPPQEISDEAGFELHSVAASDRKQCIEIAKYESLFKKAKETAGDKVKGITLKSVCALQGEVGSSDNVTPMAIEVIATRNAKCVSSIEVHPTKEWFMTTHHDGNLRVWNYKTQDVLNLFEALDGQVYVAKFVEEWIVAGDCDGRIHVSSYDESKDAISFEAHSGRIMSLAVHPNNPYNVLSSSDNDHLIKLWNWDPLWDFEIGWVCTRTFNGHSGKVSQVIFDPEDKGRFASASSDCTAKIWSLDSDICKTTFGKHRDCLTCVDYFTGADCQRHIITGSTDGTVQIWDLNTKRCIENLEGHTDKICVVYFNMELRKLITGSLDGTVRIWDSITYRLEKVIAFNLGKVYGLGYIEDCQRIVVGCDEGIAMMEINSP